MHPVSRCSQGWGVIWRAKKENKKIRQKEQENLLNDPTLTLAVRVGHAHCHPLHLALLSCIQCHCCPVFSVVVVVLSSASLLSCVQHCLPCIHCHHPMIIVVMSSPCCCHVTSLVFILSLSSPLSIIPTICYPCCSLCLPFAIPAICPCVIVWCPYSIVINTTISPYKQWLTDGVVVLCDVAPIATLWAEARSSSIGWGGSVGHSCCGPETGLGWWVISLWN